MYNKKKDKVRRERVKFPHINVYIFWIQFNSWLIFLFTRDLKTRFHLAAHVYSGNAQMTTKCGKNKEVHYEPPANNNNNNNNNQLYFTSRTTDRMKLWIYEIHIFELRNEEINVKKILAVI